MFLAVATLYAERNEEKRQQFLAEIELINPDDLVFLDESGIDEYLQRDYARAERGFTIISDVYGRKYGRISVIAAWLPPCTLANVILSFFLKVL